MDFFNLGINGFILLDKISRCLEQVRLEELEDSYQNN